MKKVKTGKKTTALSTRAVAAQVILQVLDQGKSLSALLPEVQTQIKAQDLPLLQEICFGICRVLPRLEQIIRKLVDKSLKGKTRIAHCLLLVGLYQLLYTRVPAHAAVDEAVNATKALKVESFRSLINAVLRRFLREQETVLAEVDKHWQTLHPEWLVNQFKAAYSNWREIVEANNQKPPMWLRVNQRHCTTENYQQLLAQHDIESFKADNPQALRLAQAVAVSNLPNFDSGWVTVQDLHAQWSALLLEPQDNDLILDACAAPGGKTTHILECAPNARVVALDVEESRLKRVHENLARMKQTAQVADITPLVELQAKILTALWEKLKPNGVLLYATCSLLPDENSLQIQCFLQQTPNAELMPLPFQTDKSAVGFQFVPSPLGGDGFYYAKLRKTEILK